VGDVELAAGAVGQQLVVLLQNLVHTLDIQIRRQKGAEGGNDVALQNGGLCRTGGRG
jgi:hypothetical protein